MRFLILAITFLFSFIAFFSNITEKNISNPFTNYFSYGLTFILSHMLFFVILFLAAIVFYIRISRFEKKHPKHKIFFLSAIQVIFSFLAGLFFSFLLLFFIAFLELNFLAYVINMDPKLLGIENDLGQIVKLLKANNLPPQIIASDNNHYKELQGIAYATTGTENFYGAHILPSIPSFVVLPTKKIASTLLLDNTLIFSEINQSDLEKISPIIGYQLIQHYFPTRYIKAYPKILTMDLAEYEKYRIADFNKKAASINNDFKKNELNISSGSAAIKEDNDNISHFQNLVKTTYSQKNKQLSQCISEGYYDNGIFKKLNSREYCQKQVLGLDDIILNTNRQLDKVTQKLQYDQTQLDTARYFADIFKAEIELTKLSAKNIPHELGSFVPNNTIKIVIDNKSSHAVADYFETAIHEYLHYASYSDAKTLQTGFFEEGLTEYFARQTILNFLSTNTNLGYPVFVKIISKMTNRIAENEFADIYFSKDEQKLESTLDRVYGDNFYKNNLLLLETLQFTTDSKQILKIANKIMDNIGENHLKETDLVSNSSSL
jgi:hypothetical protein